MNIKVKLKDKDLDCTHYKMRNKEGLIAPCICDKKHKGDVKNLRFYSKVTRNIGQ